ncbi:DUF726 domain-containing protein [Rothia nasisuis]|uniref:DUF726 domain-containing protein n=1 Tax=Rothia nasisuis TaxID=2109647 RepID=UPI001F26CB20|nr:DUF726 domain-containing protein [Rothia nasisuis]
MNSTIYSRTRLIFKNEGIEGASAELQVPLSTAINIMWEGENSDPQFTGDAFFIHNSLFKAAFFDYLIHKKAQQKAAAEDVLPQWEETPDEEHANFQDDSAAEKTYEEKLASLRKDTKKAEATLLELATILAFGPKQDNFQDAYCSACIEFSRHLELATPLTWSDAYICDNCNVVTAACSVPGCSHFALRGFGRTGMRSASLPLCAEHTHEIPSFDRAKATLSDLSHWDTLFEYEKADIKKVAKRGATIATVASLAIPFAYVAAPGIGAAIGAAKGLHGVAALNHGLALLGGGSLAAGGMGMAGGQLVVTAIGSGLGGVAGMRVASAYMSKDSSFNIETIRGGEGPAVVFASGFTTEEDQKWARWKRVIDTLYPKNPVYRVYWGAKELKDLGVYLGMGGLGGAGGLGLQGLAAKGVKRAAKNLGGVGVANAALGLVTNPWTTASNRAKQAGSALASILARTENTDGFILVGHSLGGALMATTAAALANGEDKSPVVGVHLLGAAYPASAATEPLANGVNGKVFNYHSLNDEVLRKLYKVGALGKTAAGFKGFSQEHPRVINVDVTDKVPGHRKYIDFVALLKD